MSSHSSRNVCASIARSLNSSRQVTRATSLQSLHNHSRHAISSRHASYATTTPPRRDAYPAARGASSTTPPPARRAASASSSTPSNSTPSSTSTTSASPPATTTTAAKPTPPTASSSGPKHNERSLSNGLSDSPYDLATEPDATLDWSRSFHGLSATPFSPEAAAALLQPINPDDVEIKPDGIIYLPEIKYRRILNKAFGPGGWGLAPRGETIVTPKSVTREYGLVAGGRLVSIARGEQQYFDPEGIPTATEGCKSNALMRCCKDLGVASELWDPRFIRGFMKQHSKKVWVEHVVTKKKKQITLRKDDEPSYPFQVSKIGSASGSF
ncbi:Mgm101p-domain-containing protein [Saccharata proteae CBS 121410]|uniref:Mitochondrial genome maintenance protein MGM101 n=1 Tax=Saccharata proteae CBS 121410 TaxID=1314787 RepID=A0A9P4LWK7_9PEZI|nr:Mgm101p-domain-containing protein [Saccharata proteae CBS 121410]